MRTITAFKIRTTNLSNIELVLHEMKEAIRKDYQKHLNKLLALEAENLSDAITFGIIQRPEISIESAAIQALKQKIYIAEAQRFDTEYNLSVFVQVLTIVNETIFKITSANEIFVKRMNRIKDLIPVHLFNDKEDEKLNAFWGEIMDKYKDDASILNVQLMSGLSLAFDIEKCHFASREERAGRAARHRIMNRLLHQYAGGGEIRPEYLMDFVDAALLRISNDPGISGEMDILKNDALRSLVNITPALLKRFPGDDSIVEMPADEEEACSEDPTADLEEPADNPEPSGHVSSEEEPVSESEKE